MFEQAPWREFIQLVFYLVGRLATSNPSRLYQHGRHSVAAAGITLLRAGLLVACSIAPAATNRHVRG